MARVFVTGSTTGLGLAVAEEIIDSGNEVVLHARNEARLSAIKTLLPRAAGVVIGDLANRIEVSRIAEQVNVIGGIDAVIHNAAIYAENQRILTAEGHVRTFAVNVLAPYLLTLWIQGPNRQIYISSEMHRDGDMALDDLDWTSRSWNAMQAYSDSKLYVTTFAMALARRWPHTNVNVVDPGWVPTRMGGVNATDDLNLGHRTQSWLAVSSDPEANTTNGYWYHKGRKLPTPVVLDGEFQDALVDKLAEVTGVSIS